MGLTGAILGDIAGQPFEFQSEILDFQYEDYDLYHHPMVERSHITDDSVLSIATGMAILESKEKCCPVDFVKWYNRLGNTYSYGYGPAFVKWLNSDNKSPYGSFGNGSAMRVSPCFMINGDYTETIKLAEESAAVTHNHPEGIKGAKVAATIGYMLKTGRTKDQCLEYMLSQYSSKFNYEFGVDIPLKEYKDRNIYSPVCQTSLPIAFRCFYETNSFVEMMHTINLLLDDCDTLGAIAGAWAEEYYGNCLGSKEKDEEAIREHLSGELLEFYNRIQKGIRICS